MEIPRLSASPDVFVRLGVALVAALEDDPEVVEHATPIRHATTWLQAAATARHDALEVRVTKLKLRERADYTADTLLRDLQKAALESSAGDRSAEPHHTLFPNGVTAVVGLPLSEQVAEMAIIAGKLEAIPALAEHAPAVRAARDKLATAIDAYGVALRDAAAASAQLELAKRDWVRSYRSIYEALLQLFLDRRHAGSYFVSSGDRRPGDDGEPHTPGH